MLSSALFHFSNKETSLHPTQVPGVEENELELCVTRVGVRSVQHQLQYNPFNCFVGVSLPFAGFLAIPAVKKTSWAVTLPLPA